jgi:Mesyanzhinovviridae DNA polymerase
MFFDDVDLGPPKKRTILRVPPPTPETGWRPPQYFPNLSDAAMIGFDLERKEDDWDHGPGWTRGKASTVGFSVSAIDRLGNVGAWYFPIRHMVESEFNLDANHCFGWLRNTLQHTPTIPKVGANLLYDVGSLTDDGIYVSGELHDVQFAEPLLQSDGLVNLDHLGVKYTDTGKDTNELYEWCALAYGGKPNGEQRMNIWRASPRLAGPYGERDALLPIRVLQKQWPILESQGLLDIYRMECDLIRLLVRMRQAGVSVDVARAHKLYDDIAVDVARLYEQLYRDTGVRIESANSGRDIARVFDAVGIQYPLTDEGNPSFRKDWMTNLDHPVATLINNIREHEKIRSTFVRNYIIEGQVNGKLHCQFHPLRNDDGGAKTGRFSSSDPNLQNIPVRTALGKAVRRCFVYDPGHIAWEKNDYSQIEYRDLAHFAVDNGDGSAERLRQKYRDDPKTDYHKLTQENVKARTGRLIERRPIKNMNFGLVYGMQEAKLIRQNGFKPEEGRDIFKSYHEGNPYVKPTMKAAADEMQIYGYITTILNRRIHFSLWEPMDRVYGQPRKPGLPYEMAIRQYGSRIKRADEHKAINYRLQGSAAEQIKAGMRACYNAGIFDVTGVPRLQVHDELDFSVADDSPQTQEAFREMRHVLENAIPIRVPVRVDHDRAPNWGDVKE